VIDVVPWPQNDFTAALFFIRVALESAPNAGIIIVAGSDPVFPPLIIFLPFSKTGPILRSRVKKKDGYDVDSKEAGRNACGEDHEHGER
jgi:hypothetical protein